MNFTHCVLAGPIAKKTYGFFLHIYHLKSSLLPLEIENKHHTHTHLSADS